MKTSLLKLTAWISLGSALTTAAAHASDSVNSELSHFAGNLALASATTVVVDKYWPEVNNPARTGFIVSTAEAFLGELASKATGGRFSLLDAVVGTVGAAAGAYATDKWYIAPKVATQNGDSTYGVVATRRF